VNRVVLAAVIVSAFACRQEQHAKVEAPKQAHDDRAPVDAASIPALSSSRDAGPDAGGPMSPLDQAMARLVKAMVSNDPGTVLACFSKRKPTWLISSGPDGHTRKMKFPYRDIEKGMKPDGDFWYYFFDDDSELVRGVQRSQRWPLVNGSMFVPPEYASDPANAPAAVRWRKEGDAYVIDAIFDSGA
jgi:hypothetical protein